MRPPMYLWVTAANVSWHNPVYLLNFSLLVSGFRENSKAFEDGRFFPVAWTSLSIMGNFLSRTTWLCHDMFILGTAWTSLCSPLPSHSGRWWQCASRSPKLPLIGGDYPFLPCSHPGTEGTVLIQIRSLPLLAVVFQQVTSPLWTLISLL